MELRQIRYFIATAKHEHVSKAADSLHIAQSAVSRQIVNLEEELGVDLFIREGRNVRLTTIGRVFLEHMENALNVIDDARQVIDEYTDPEKGTIHLGFPSSLSTIILPTVISEFRKIYPNVKFKLSQKSYYNLIDSVKRGNINMALLAPVPKDVKDVKGHGLFTERIQALLPLNHRLAKHSSIKLTDIRNDEFILFPENFVLRDLAIDACKQAGFVPKVAVEVEDIDAIKGLVSAGLGVALLPEVTLVDNLLRDTVRKTVTEPYISRTLGVIVPNNRKLLPTETLFTEFLQEFFQRMEKFRE